MRRKIKFPFLIVVSAVVAALIDRALGIPVDSVATFIWILHLLVHVLFGMVLVIVYQKLRASENNDNLFSDYKQEKGGTKWG